MPKRWIRDITIENMEGLLVITVPDVQPNRANHENTEAVECSQRNVGTVFIVDKEALYNEDKSKGYTYTRGTDEGEHGRAGIQ